jgi:hypothetical protein
MSEGTEAAAAAQFQGTAHGEGGLLHKMSESQTEIYNLFVY